MIRWLCRCIPGLSALCLIILLVFAFGDFGRPQRLPLIFPQEENYNSHLHQAYVDPTPPGLKLSQKIFIFYTLLIHCDTSIFALRLLLSIFVVKRGIKTTLLRRNDLPSGFYSEGVIQHTDAQELDRRSPPLTPTNKLEQSSNEDEVLHAIVIPNYQEDIDTLRLTLAVLAAHPRAVTQYKVSHVTHNWCIYGLLIWSALLCRFTWLWNKRSELLPRKRLS
jgi:hypothetical protein